MSEKWTKGPWVECKDGKCSCGMVFGDGGSVYVAKAFTIDNDAVDPVPTDEQAEANACLIATAPDLVEALASILDANTEFRKSLPADWPGDPVNDACERAKPVLAKARGETA